MTDNSFTSHAVVDAGVARVTLVGELDWDTAPSVHEVVAACLVKRPRSLRLDLTGVHFCDCSGLTALFTVRNAVLRAGVEFHVAGVGTQLSRLLSLIGADGLLTETNTTSTSPGTVHRAGAEPAHRAAETLTRGCDAAASVESRLRDLLA
ncbi:STAS domain-containing protein [Streptomyces sp. NPDC050703]|uniref:STAS domain-containing protein n=1 Tax=Streptomyces sp. NPDC050703 TaxID=3157218 RepID=UPI00342E1A9A